MNDPVKQYDGELIAKNDPEQGHDDANQKHEDAGQHGHGADGHEAEQGPFQKLLGTLGDHREIEVGPLHVVDLPVILVDDGLQVFSSVDALEESPDYAWNHETHAVERSDGGAPTLDMSITSLIVFEWIAMAILCAIFIPMARKYKKLGARSQKGFFNAMEALVEYVRDNIVVANVGKGKVGRSVAPVLITFFFFILVMNLLGLVPGGHSATGSLSVTAGLAIIAFFVIQYAAIRDAGFLAWLKHLTGGTPWPLWIIMIPIEIVGLFAKPFALCVRLFANMTGGHVIILSLVGLVFVGAAFIPVTVGFSLFIGLLEILVAFIQAYIFAILTAVFASMGMHHAHDEPETEGAHAEA